MLITFKCQVKTDITMFGDVAQRLLHIMGYDGTRPGVILVKDIPAVRNKLKNISRNEKGQDQDDEAVSLAHRAFPLIEMLDEAEKEECTVQWEIA